VRPFWASFGFLFPGFSGFEKRENAWKCCISRHFPFFGCFPCKIRNQQVAGSSPAISSKTKGHFPKDVSFCFFFYFFSSTAQAAIASAISDDAPTVKREAQPKVAIVLFLLLFDFAKIYGNDGCKNALQTKVIGRFCKIHYSGLLGMTKAAMM
jgi:hypothetical protein